MTSTVTSPHHPKKKGADSHVACESVYKLPVFVDLALLFFWGKKRKTKPPLKRLQSAPQRPDFPGRSFCPISASGSCTTLHSALSCRLHTCNLHAAEGYYLVCIETCLQCLALTAVVLPRDPMDKFGTDVNILKTTPTSNKNCSGVRTP